MKILKYLQDFLVCMFLGAVMSGLITFFIFKMTSNAPSIDEDPYVYNPEWELVSYFSEKQILLIFVILGLRMAGLFLYLINKEPKKDDVNFN